MTNNIRSREINSDIVCEAISYRKYISEDEVKDFAIEKYESNGNGITFKNIIRRFPVKKSAQRSLRYFHTKGSLFTTDDLLWQGINLIQNKSPQHYFPTCIKADIIEKLTDRRSVDPTEVSFSLTDGLSSYPVTAKYSSSDPLEYQKAQSFLDVLVQPKSLENKLCVFFKLCVIVVE